MVEGTPAQNSPDLGWMGVGGGARDTGTSDVRLGWRSGGRGTVLGQPCPSPPLQLPGGSKAGLWLVGEGFMAGGDTTGDLSLGHGQRHLLRHLPA